ncbi:putative SET (Su(var)3-9, Enhancer-of-zeste, Trithorax) domain containing protein [Lyophyllum shimeji]|uniref:SET (Su(Var)3-9, Enhancer-of-zeste, Trithorax) domain containing protein n=1 Tax=Lyophyllum shimeji TaxID=47721 RepID=A0A9P3PJA5_LYOSH|nr:putative SET (Su(var)3-9, Enhancer-of-zeste, Trithorax) domain containing protein [Lyophyllum shimeji]
MAPPHWPSHIQYLQCSQFHSSVPPEVRLIIQGNSNTNKQPTKHRPPVVIRRITSTSHPAQGQCGLFAAKKIPPQTHVIDYIGEIHCDDRPDSDYDLSLYRGHDGVNAGIDASRMGNEARFVNDYRGIAAKPNAVFSDLKTPLGEMRMSIWSSGQEIKKGEEILVSYGKAWWRARQTNVPDFI